MSIRNRAIDNQLIKPVTGIKGWKQKTKLVDLQKELLTTLNVPYTDLCCEAGNQSPLGAPVRFFNGELQQLADDGTWTVISTGGDTPNFMNGLEDFGGGDIGVGNSDITNEIYWENGYANEKGFGAEMSWVDLFAADPNFDSYTEVYLYTQDDVYRRGRIYMVAYSWNGSSNQDSEIEFYTDSDPHDNTTERLVMSVGGTIATGGASNNRYAEISLRHNANGKYLDLGFSGNSGQDKGTTLILGKFYNGTSNEFVYSTNGALIYDTANNKFKAYENGAWVNLIGGGGGISGIAVQEEGVTTVALATTLNFIGGSATVTDVGGVATITFSAGGISWPLESPNSHSNQFKVVTADGSAGLGFSMESGGWSSIYLGGIPVYASPGSNDKGSIYIGMAAGQARTDGGDFNVYIGYQSGIGAPGTSYKFYLGQGASNHLMYGDFFNGGLSIKGGIYVGGVSGDWTTMPLPTARVEIQASTGAAGTGPLKLTSGTNLVTPVNGMFEYNGTTLFFTTGGVRKTVTLV